MSCMLPDCEWPSWVVVKVHHRSDPLLGGPYAAVCFRHVVDVFTEVVDKHANDDDFFGISVLRDSQA